MLIDSPLSHTFKQLLLGIPCSYRVETPGDHQVEWCDFLRQVPTAADGVAWRRSRTMMKQNGLVKKQKQNMAPSPIKVKHLPFVAWWEIEHVMSLQVFWKWWFSYTLFFLMIRFDEGSLGMQSYSQMMIGMVIGSLGFNLLLLFFLAPHIWFFFDDYTIIYSLHLRMLQDVYINLLGICVSPKLGCTSVCLYSTVGWALGTWPGRRCFLLLIRSRVTCAYWLCFAALSNTEVQFVCFICQQSLCIFSVNSAHVFINRKKQSFFAMQKKTSTIRRSWLQCPPFFPRFEWRTCGNCMWSPATHDLARGAKQQRVRFQDGMG